MTERSIFSAPLDEAPLDPTLLERYWLKETSADETAIVERWFAKHPEWRARYERQWRGVKSEPWTPLDTGEINHALTSVLDAVGIRRENGVLKAPLTSPVLHLVDRQRTSPTRAAIARVRDTMTGTLRRSIAIAGVAAMGVAVALMVNRSSDTRRPMASNPGFVYATANGERANIVLPDGSTVLLNVGSRLEVPANFAVGNRTLNLSGEALFTVTHHTGVPFNVIAGGNVTRVLGTSFVVRHYTTDSATTVTVRDGKVAVRSTVLTAMQRAVVYTGRSPQIEGAGEESFSFVNGVLVLDGVSLADAAIELSRWYNADIHLGDPDLGKQRIKKGRFTTGSLSDLAMNLEWTFDLRVVRTGRSLTLYSKQ